MPDLSSGGLFWKRTGFDGVRPITFIFQTWLWNRKRPGPQKWSCALPHRGLRGVNYSRGPSMKSHWQLGRSRYANSSFFHHECVRQYIMRTLLFFHSSVPLRSNHPLCIYPNLLVAVDSCRDKGVIPHWLPTHPLILAAMNTAIKGILYSQNDHLYINN